MKELKSRDTEFYTYKSKQESNFKVVLKYMHSSSNINDIRKEIENHKHIVINLWNIKK
jgi:FtsZ-interacting cell division protein YlmF